jgi:hypothetical protein
MEMPTVQLMHLLPNYENEILPQHQARGNYFHWIPQEVADGLFLDRSNFGEILNKIFSDNGVSKISNWEDPNSFKILEKNRQNSGVKIVEMDEAAKDFYALYGNCSVEELNNCYSVELGTVAFLEALRENLDIKVTKNDSEKEKLTRAKENIDSMIERENERKNQIKPDTSIAQASAAQLYQNQIQEVKI